jgi:hypothetical protein
MLLGLEMIFFFFDYVTQAGLKILLLPLRSAGIIGVPLHAWLEMIFIKFWHDNDMKGK